MAIGGTAKWSEIRICEYVPNSRLIDGQTRDMVPDYQKNGDIVVIVETPEGNYIIVIEVKSSSKEEKPYKNLTMNQVRAMKYMVLIAVVSNIEKYGVDCVVYPPDYVVERGATHRGQHTPDGVCVQNWQPTKDEVARFGCTFSEVHDRIIKAHKRGEENLKAKTFAENRRKLYDKIEEENRNYFA